MSRLRSIAFAVAVVAVLIAVPQLVGESRSDDVASANGGSDTDAPGATVATTPVRRKAPPAGARFEAGVVPFVVNLDNAPDGALDAVLAAAEQWNQVELGIEFDYLGPTELEGNAFDAVNVIWWDAGADPTASFIAVTSNHWRAATPPMLEEFDIVFRADRTFATDGRADAWDVETVALHEFGHAIGLGHAELDRLLQVMHPRLAPGETNRRLTARDVDAARELYQTPPVLDVGLFLANDTDPVAEPGDGGLFD